MSLRPFFTYFGSKWGSVPHYPQPEHDLIVEPFAGSAGYATRYPERQILLIDRDPIIVGVWQFLIRATAGEILSLPDVRESIEELAGYPQEARWLAGFWLQKGNAAPASRPSAWARSGLYKNRFWGENIRRRIASQVDRIRHWRISHGSFEIAPPLRATWFVDAPYEGACGSRYRNGHQGLDYEAIGLWCRRRYGLTIVCEQAGALWLPFRPFRRTKAIRSTAWSDEVVWIRRDRPQQLQLWASGASNI